MEAESDSGDEGEGLGNLFSSASVACMQRAEASFSDLAELLSSVPSDVKEDVQEGVEEGVEEEAVEQEAVEEEAVKECVVIEVDVAQPVPPWRQQQPQQHQQPQQQQQEHLQPQQHQQPQQQQQEHLQQQQQQPREQQQYQLQQTQLEVMQRLLKHQGEDQLQQKKEAVLQRLLKDPDLQEYLQQQNGQVQHEHQEHLQQQHQAVSAAAAEHLQQHPQETPEAMGVPISWDQVIYLEGTTKMNIGVAPVDAPFPNMVFKGYDVSPCKRQVAAWFVRVGATGPGTRRPGKGVGQGLNRAWHQNHNIAKRQGAAEAYMWKKNNTDDYIPKHRRLFVCDPDI